MQAVTERAAPRKFPGVRLVQTTTIVVRSASTPSWDPIRASR
jgi:hypothetical protein